MASRHKRKKDGDSPITVGGGGGKRSKNIDPDEIRIKFDHNKYSQDGDFWSNSDLQLDSVTVNKKNIPVTKASGIVITYDRGVQHDNIIRINEGRMSVRFFQDHFPHDVSQLQHHGRGAITKIKIGAQEIDPLPTEITIVAHSVLKKRTNRAKKNSRRSASRR